MSDKKKRYHSLIEENIGIIRKLSRGYTNGEEDFEDTVQEVCLQLWRSFDSFRGDSKASTWVYRVTLNVCLSLLKRRKRVELVPTEQGVLHQVVEAQGDHGQQDPQIDQLYRAINTLAPIDRAIIMLYLDKLEHAEIAEIVGLGVSNVGVKINRIKKKLKKIIHG
ncbi:MAG TPA: RNA polymerase [Cytophagales bacterium]|nr:RNA polymerase [Cytophagales bacterium]HAP61574.1 RNA polymerase [Cytophagales bacterium]